MIPSLCQNKRAATSFKAEKSIGNNHLIPLFVMNQAFVDIMNGKAFELGQGIRQQKAGFPHSNCSD